MKFRRPSTSMAVSLAALTLAATGTAGAATGLIGTNQIKNGAVTAVKMHQGSVGPYNLNAASKKLIASNAGKTGKTGATGKTGPAGQSITGPQGPAGPAGPNDISKINFRAPAGTGATNVFSADGITLYAACNGAGAISITAQATDTAPGILAYSLTTNAGSGSNGTKSSTGTNVGNIFWYTDSAFGAGSNGNAAPFSGPTIVLTSAYNTNNQPATGSGASDTVQFNYTSAGGTVVTGQFATTDNSTNTGTSSNTANPGPSSIATCVAYGTASTL